MKILAIIGSHRAGNTLKAVQELKLEMLQHHSGLEFEYVNIWQKDIKICKGCFVCLARGIEKCPLKDDIPGIIEKMQAADGIILASPVYVMNVTPLMKNFIDRLSSYCHRPAFFHQKVLAVITTGGAGGGKVLNYMNSIAQSWGMQGAVKMGQSFPPMTEIPSKFITSNRVNITQAAGKFSSLLTRKTFKPTISSVIQFEAQKAIFTLPEVAEGLSADAAFYGDLKNKNYWVPAEIPWYKSLIARIIGKIILIQMK
jgi:multimeric flavodoxin WrbA